MLKARTTDLRLKLNKTEAQHVRAEVEVRGNLILPFVFERQGNWSPECEWSGPKITTRKLATRALSVNNCSKEHLLNIYLC